MPVTTENYQPAADNSSGLLSDLLADIDNQETSENKALFCAQTIDNQEQANYLLGKLNALETQITDAETTAGKYLSKTAARVENWKQSVVTPLRAKADVYKSLLRGWAEQQLTGARSKQIKLINGTLKFKTTAKYDYQDEAAILDFLTRHSPDCLRVKREIDKSRLKTAGTVADERLLLDGQPVPGLTVSQTTDFYATA
jgi:hypothetical protein